VEDCIDGLGMSEPFIDFTCPHCGNELRVEADHAGRSAWCRKCKRVAFVPRKAHAPVAEARSASGAPIRGRLVLGADLGLASTPRDPIDLSATRTPSHAEGRVQPDARHQELRLQLRTKDEEIARLIEQRRQASEMIASSAAEIARLTAEFESARRQAASDGSEADRKRAEEAEARAAELANELAGTRRREEELIVETELLKARFMKTADYEARLRMLEEKDRALAEMQRALRERESEAAALAAQLEAIRGHDARGETVIAAPVQSDALVAELDKTRAQLESREDDLLRMMVEMDTLRDALRQSEAAVASARAELEVQSRAESTLESERCSYQAQVSELHQELEARRKGFEVELRAERERLEGQLRRLVDQAQALADERDGLIVALENARADHGDAFAGPRDEIQRARLEEDYRRACAELEATRADLERSAAEIDRLRLELENALAKVVMDDAGVRVTSGPVFEPAGPSWQMGEGARAFADDAGDDGAAPEVVGDDPDLNRRMLTDALLRFLSRP
jgi:chromosome segregation ATPase